MKVDQQCWGPKGLSKEKGPLLLLSKRFQTFGLFVMLDDEISQIRRLPPPKSAQMMNSRNPHSPVRNMRTSLQHKLHTKKVIFRIFSQGTPLSPAAVARNLLRNKQLSVTSRPQQQQVVAYKYKYNDKYKYRDKYNDHDNDKDNEKDKYKQLSVSSRPQQQGGGGVQRLSPQKQNGGQSQQRPSPQGGQ